ncbi:low molecular weight phosphatase family protein [Pseudoclavibacter endophyticus]|uniref:arsenate-mycothiol transferase ArsC n=1 Tax=Pseudoclavibacter endophyticus TaxID=1778590 RepID=UPI0019A54C4B|nr:low molecular weight phosphatase family protein [Pseudoclavibacter endophyticus]GGA75617.1 low molecular weight phosphatase family protein [Pseudoclavibacter endophyticus]
MIDATIAGQGTAAPYIVFVCKKNGGKSQMAAALMRHEAGDRVHVASAGTAPGETLNAQSVESLAELGIGVGDEQPKPLTDEMVAAADLIVVLGAEARVEPANGTPVETWITDEPSERGIGGMERMRLVRDDIAARVRELAARFVHGAA